MAESQANENADDENEHPFDVAKRTCNDVNEQLAETNGAIAEMSFSGAIGYHVYVANGETEPEFLWKTALLEAMDETVFEMMFVDQEHPADARYEVERQLKQSMDPLMAESVADRFEDKLRNLIDVQEQTPEPGAASGDD